MKAIVLPILISVTYTTHTRTNFCSYHTHVYNTFFLISLGKRSFCGDQLLCFVNFTQHCASTCLFIDPTFLQLSSKIDATFLFLLQLKVVLVFKLSLVTSFLAAIWVRFKLVLHNAENETRPTLECIFNFY